MLKLDSLPPATRRVFDMLLGNARLQSFTLIGGTAMSLQMGHRRSEDLDFWLPAKQLDKDLIASLIRQLQQNGLTAELVTPHSQIVASRINGIDLLAHAQDYVIDGVKVTFFARQDVAFGYFDGFKRVLFDEASFRLMCLDGIFAMKAHVIHQRVRSRDLFDLMSFVISGRAFEDVFNRALDADPANSTEYAKCVLTGLVPVDKDDEGFDSIQIKTTLQDVYSFFQSAVDTYEQQLAERILLESVCKTCKQFPCACKKQVS